MLKLLKKIRDIKKRLRIKYWSLLFREFGDGSRVLGGIKVIRADNVSIGKMTSLNEGVFLNARTQLIIGNHCHISPGVIINTGSLDINIHYKKRPHIEKEVRIGDGVWLCSGVLINPGVTIGEGAVVAAGSVVNHDVESFTVVGGVPAKFIKKLDN